MRNSCCDHRNIDSVKQCVETRHRWGKWFLRIISQHAFVFFIVNKDTPAGCIPALTTLPRTEWYNIRREHFSDGINKDSLDIIDKALFIVSCGSINSQS